MQAYGNADPVFFYRTYALVSDNIVHENENFALFTIMNNGQI